MNTSFFIARRYFISKRKLKLINIISLISLVAITITTAALLIIISVFNGFEKIGQDLFLKTNPSITVEAKKGKVFSTDTLNIDQIRQIDGIAVSCVLKENALLVFKDRQIVVTMFGVDERFRSINRIDTAIVAGEYILSNDNTDFVVLGEMLAQNLHLTTNYYNIFANLNVVVPKREKTLMTSLDAFNYKNIVLSGIVFTNSRLDEEAAFVSLDFARQILDYENKEVSAIYIETGKENINEIKQKTEQICGQNYEVKTIREQEPLYNKIVRSEKLGVYIILCFILFIATFNVIGTLSLLVMDKQQDIFILSSMGLTHKKISKIFFLNAMFLSLLGAVLGILLGLGVCILQQRFGLIKISASQFVLDAFPVVIKVKDILTVFALVVAIGYISISLLLYKRIKVEKN